jgi:hypothetical protein
MKNGLIIRFSIAEMLISLGCLLLLTGFSGIGIFFGLAVLFYMPRSELNRPIPRTELWMSLGILAAFIAAVVACKFLVPVSIGTSIQRIIRHPAFVVPLWLLMLGGLYCHWQQQRNKPDA